MVRFNQDYRGKLTSELFYEAGQNASFDPAIEQALVGAGRAEYVTPGVDGPESVQDERSAPDATETPAAAENMPPADSGVNMIASTHDDEDVVVIKGSRGKKK